jgi:hypothetical protein
VSKVVKNANRHVRQIWPPKVCEPGASANLQLMLGLKPAKWKIENIHETFGIKVTLATDANLQSEMSSEF